MIDVLLDGFELEPRVLAAARRVQSVLERRDPRSVAVRARVMRAFLDEGIAESDLAGTTGYGYDDAARERYESLLARVFRAERVLARLSIVSGTHAIVAGLDALLPVGAMVLAANGAPYDTLRHALVTAPYSLVARGVRYAEVDRTPEGETDLVALRDRVRAERPAVVFVQRSRGYAARRSLSVDAIAVLVEVVRDAHPDAIVFVDNCYGELVEAREPLEVGADVLAGSLIKNVGGGLAPTGGYLAGRGDLLDRIAARVFAPGIGAGLGPTLGFGRALVQGLFYAPLVVAETLRGLDFAAALFAELGFAVDPGPGELRTDIVQAIRLGTRERLIAFARGLQRAMPINARFAPEPGPVPGYVDPVIMSSGSFVSGATIDLSCDAPLRAPYEVYLQGGVTAEHTALGAILAADAVVRLA
ncbi:MAG: methionine gamma-lyase family protein [Candidatus Eremiobacteraeota bacterium]|nr:methionine gamma-lyase family protein [Candidatus Eremiobacteraeota bacterium]